MILILSGERLTLTLAQEIADKREVLRSREYLYGDIDFGVRLLWFHDLLMNVCDLNQLK